ncbi:MAG: transcription termination/antitermination protein NusA, partial [Chloroflexi bacterium]|nr:transcription termination/antitermination protein NusA [Chloroflexota bacterium]
MKNEFILAINSLCTERGLSRDVVLEAIEAALISAYRKTPHGTLQNVTAQMDPNTGKATLLAEKEVVDKVEDDQLQITLDKSRVINPKANIGDTVVVEVTPADFGRIAAQTAKQVIMQRIREAERDQLYENFAERQGDIINGTVQNVSPQGVSLSLGKTEAILPRSEQIPTERYGYNQRVRALVMEVNRTARGPQIVVSRTHRDLLKRLLELEVPEIYNGTVEIMAIAREAGSRSKVAVRARQEGIDPVGSCVGMRGVRIQSIVNELSGEKIDVVEWNVDTSRFIANALSPATVVRVDLHDSSEGKTASVIVPDRQLSLAIGKEGQNARLAAKLTGWRIDIKSESEAIAEAERRMA